MSVHTGVGQWPGECLEEFGGLAATPPWSANWPPPPTAPWRPLHLRQIAPAVLTSAQPPRHDPDGTAPSRLRPRPGRRHRHHHDRDHPPLPRPSPAPRPAPHATTPRTPACRPSACTEPASSSTTIADTRTPPEPPRGDAPRGRSSAVCAGCRRTGERAKASTRRCAEGAKRAARASPRR